MRCIQAWREVEGRCGDTSSRPARLNRGGFPVQRHHDFFPFGEAGYLGSDKGSAVLAGACCRRIRSRGAHHAAERPTVVSRVEKAAASTSAR
jgi:hypothetical protein